MTSFISQFEGPRVIAWASELPLANKSSKQPDLFEITNAPRAYEQVQTEFYLFNQAETPFE
ncbi:MAG TPA: hypothetical protein VN951_16465 [Pyrinomonadaceae bacterium]|nr:hypothetical protein [Pyrinomonadaceae bacterium]